MKKPRFTEAQIIGFIKQAESGMPVPELCRKEGTSNKGKAHEHKTIHLLANIPR